LSQFRPCISHSLTITVGPELEGRFKSNSYVVGLLCSIMQLHNFFNSLTGLWIGFGLTEPISLCSNSFFVYASFVFYYILYYCSIVRWTRWDWSLILRTTTSFSALTLLVGSFDPYKPVSDMTYNVFRGSLNPAQSINQSCGRLSQFPRIYVMRSSSYRIRHLSSNFRLVAWRVADASRVAVIRSLTGDMFVFHQDNVPAHHHARDTVELLHCDLWDPQFTSPDMWHGV